MRSSRNGEGRINFGLVDVILENIFTLNYLLIFKVSFRNMFLFCFFKILLKFNYVLKIKF